MVLDLFQASCQADALCMVYCKAQANLLLECDDATLVRVKAPESHEHIVWVDPSALQNGIFSFTRAFYETQTEFDEDIGSAVTMEAIKPDQDIICYNGSSYYLYKAKTGNYCIRRLRAYCSQRIVEEMERQTAEEKGEIENIFLSNLYLFDGKEHNYALTCWGIVYASGCNYLPVFDEDQHYVRDYNLSAFTRKEIPVGGIFKNNGCYYKLKEDESGKLYLEYSKMVFALNRTENTKPPEFKTARVISVNFRK